MGQGEGDEEDWGDAPVLDAAACAARLQTEAFAEAALYEEARQFYPAKVAAALLRASGATLCAPVRVRSLEAEVPSGAERGAERGAEAPAACSEALSWQQQSLPPTARGALTLALDGPVPTWTTQTPRALLSLFHPC